MKRKSNLRIKAFKGEYEIFNAESLRIEMFCSVCGKWVVPDVLVLGKAHVYGVHCQVSQDIGCVFYAEK